MWKCLVVIKKSVESQVCVRACVAERAAALLGKGCPRLLMRVVSSRFSCTNGLLNGARCAL